MVTSMDLRLPTWSQRGGRAFTAPHVLGQVMGGIGVTLRRAGSRVGEVYHMGDPGIPDLSHEEERVADGLRVINSYVVGMPAEITGLDQALCAAFKGGPTQALSEVRVDELTTANIPGAEGQKLVRGGKGGPVLVDYIPETLSFGDFAGATNTGVDPLMAGVFGDLHREYVAAGAGSLDLDAYIEALLTSGQFDHQGYHPGRDFISAVLDVTVVWALFKAISGHDPLTGEDLRGADRGVTAIMGVVDLVGWIFAGVTGGGSIGGAEALRLGLRKAARLLLLNALATSGAVVSLEVAREAGLPDWACVLVAMGVAVTIGAGGSRYAIKWTDASGKQFERALDIEVGQTVRTVPQGERVYTPGDVEEAFRSAPRDAQGRALDWRTGEPLRADGPDGRGWYMRWDPDNGRWVAENPGAGHEWPSAGLPATGKPNSYGYDEFGHRLPYANDRPKHTDEQIREVWNRAKMPSDGSVPNKNGSLYYYKKGDVIVQDTKGNWYKVEWDPDQPGRRPWDMGHARGKEYAKLRDQYLNHEISPEKFLEEYRKVDNYEVQDPMRNASHMDEAK